MPDYRLRLRLNKENIFLSHLEFLRAVTRALRRTGLPLKYSGACNPRVRVSAGHALALGIKSRFEFMDIFLEETVNPREAMDRLNKSLPQGISVVEAAEVSLSEDSLCGKRYLADYTFSGMPGKSMANFERLAKTRVAFIRKGREGKEKVINVMDFVRGIKIFKEKNTVEITIKTVPEEGINPVTLLKEIGGMGEEELAGIEIEKTGFKEI